MVPESRKGGNRHLNLQGESASEWWATTHSRLNPHGEPVIANRVVLYLMLDN